MVYHVNDCVAATSELMTLLDNYLDQYNRHQAMLVRLNAMDRNAPIPQDIALYVEQYIGTEGILKAIDYTITGIGKILDGLEYLIKKIIAIIKEIYALVTDKQFRQKKEFTYIGRNLMILQADPEATREFESIPCNVISKDDAMTALKKTRLFSDIIDICGKSCNSGEFDERIDLLLKNAEVDVERGEIVDKYDNLVGTHHTSFKEAGWDIDGLNSIITYYLDCLTTIDRIMATKNEIEREAKDIQLSINKARVSGLGADYVTGLQKRSAHLSRALKLVGSGINIMLKRYSAIATIVRAINVEAERIMKERKIFQPHPGIFG